MNLSTAQSENRAKEVGVRKSVGSARAQLITQFLSESLLVVTLSFLLAMIFVQVSLPAFNQLAQKQLTFPLTAPGFWLFSIGFVLLTSLLAGSYPALYLSTFQPVKVLKGSIATDHSAALFRKILVVLQFAVSIMLITGTIVVERQIQYSKNRPVGYDREGVIMIEITTSDYDGKFDLIRNELKSRGAVLEMATSSGPLTEVWNTRDGFEWAGKDPGIRAEFASMFVSHDFGDVVNWKLTAGRDFSTELASDSIAFILNEAAVNFMGLEDPVGKQVSWIRPNHQIIGVIENMVMDSPYQTVKPAVYMIDGFNSYNWILLKLNPNKSTAEALKIAKEVFKKYVPAIPFDYTFTDQEYAQKFAMEERIRKIASVFAVLAIFISCIGLFGLTAFVAAQRTKEIGIRKVLGASTANLWSLLSRDFLMLIIIACVIAIPIAYIGLSNWLENYDYRTELSWWFFAIACIAALVITCITVSYQAIKAARMNPVRSLRSE